MQKSNEQTAFLCDKSTIRDEFPEHINKIETLIADSPEFYAMVKKYHELDKKIRSLEVSDIPTSDDNFENIKKDRLHLKDEIYQKLIK